MGDRTLPTPKGMTPTQRAKREHVPVGGAPPVSIPRFDQAPAIAPPPIIKVPDVPQDSTVPGQQQMQRRSPDEINADMDKLNEAIEKHKRKARGVETEEEEKKSEEKSEEAGAKPEESDALKDAFDNMDDFEYDSYRRMLEENVLNNPKRKKKIESKCKEMDIIDLITQGEVKQEVSVVDDKYIITFRSVTGEEDLAIKRLLYTERGSPRYMLDVYSLMSLTLGLHAINRHPLPTHIDENGKFSTPLFEEKFRLVKNYPLQLLADLAVNYTWFDIRVRKLFSVEELGNG